MVYRERSSVAKVKPNMTTKYSATWPKPGDQLFLESDSSSDAWIHPSNSNRVVFAMAYWEGFESLLESVIESKDRNTVLVYPILFLLRHAVELDLKLIIVYGRRKLEVNSGKPLNNHKIAELWGEAREYVQKADPNTTRDPELEVVDSLMEEIANIDPESFTFRYPASNKGQILIDNQSFFDLLNLKSVATGLKNFLDGAGSLVMEWPER